MEHRGRSNIYYISFLIVFILVLVGGIVIKTDKGSIKNSTSVCYNILKNNLHGLNNLNSNIEKDKGSILYKIMQIEIPFLNNKVRLVKKNKMVLKAFDMEVGTFKKVDAPKEANVLENVSVFDSDLVAGTGLKPRVLIYHTHTNEAYEKTSNYADNTVVQAGRSLKEQLEKYGMEVVHDITVNDMPYDTCYTQSSKTLQKNLKENGSFDLIIDLHRDSIEYKEFVTTNINKKDMANFCLVFARNSLKHNENLELGNKIKNISQKIYPGLVRDNFFYNQAKNAFNLGIDSKLIILELGAVSNTIDEAVESTKYIARIVAEYMEDNVANKGNN